MDEHRIRQRAYEIWEREGRPEGRHAENWDRACRELQQEDGGRGLQGAEAMDANVATPGGGGNLSRAASGMRGIEDGDGGQPRGAERRAPGAAEEAGGGA